MKQNLKKPLSMLLAVMLTAAITTACGAPAKQESSSASSVPPATSGSAQGAGEPASQSEAAQSAPEAQQTLEKTPGYLTTEVRYVTPDGTPIAMENVFTSFTGKDATYATQAEAVEAGLVRVVDGGSVLIVQQQVGSTITMHFTPVAATAPEGYDETKKESAATFDAPNKDHDGAYEIYTVMCDYTQQELDPIATKESE